MTKMTSKWTGSNRDERGRPYPVAPLHFEPRPLGRSAETGGCQLPKLDEVRKTWKSCLHTCSEGRHEVDAPTTEELAADLTRPFGQSTGRGFSFTRFRIDRGYRTLTMRQQDVLATYLGPSHTATPLTLYEIGHTITHADPICRHLRWAEEYPFLVPNMARFVVNPTSSLPMHAIAYETAPLQPGQVDIHKRLRCALFHEADCNCLDSVAFAALYVLAPFCPTHKH